MKGQLNADGFVMDFGDVKNVVAVFLRHHYYTRKECKKLNQHFLLPMKSDVLQVIATHCLQRRSQSMERTWRW